MAESQIDTIVERLTRLERENRRMRRIAAAITAGVVLLVFCGARDHGEDGVITGERMLLKNKGEDSSIAMGASVNGDPAITLQRTLNGKAYSMEMRMFVADDGVPVLIFADQEGTRRYKIPR